MRLAGLDLGQRRAQLLALSLAAAVLVDGGWPPTKGMATPSPDHPLAVATTREELIAAYLFNFTKYVSWPSAAVPTGSQLTVGILGDPAVHRALAPLEGRISNGHALVVRWFTDADAVGGCQVLYVGPSDARMPAMLDRLATLPILTVTAPDEPANTGGVVHLFLDDSRLRFEIDLDAAQRAGLGVSSHLLRLVRPRPEAPSETQASESGS